MYQYRLTKFDPAYRKDGVYRRAEWTSASDVGKRFAGVEFTRAEYERVEGDYLDAALDFLNDAGVSTLVVRDVEHHADGRCPVGEDDRLGHARIRDVLRCLLREEFWCRLEADEAFIHVGYDYYMYVGVPRDCPAAGRHAEDRGLYVEDVESPYRREP